MRNGIISSFLLIFIALATSAAGVGCERVEPRHTAEAIKCRQLLQQLPEFQKAAPESQLFMVADRTRALRDQEVAASQLDAMFGQLRESAGPESEVKLAAWHYNQARVGVSQAIERLDEEDATTLLDRAAWRAEKGGKPASSEPYTPQRRWYVLWLWRT